MTVGNAILDAATRSWSRWRASADPQAIILCYHSIGTPDADPHGLAVSPRHFAEHLQVIRALGACTTIEHIAHALRNGTTSPGQVAVTFDDGYADNHATARALLESFDVPATFFVVTGYLNAQRAYWWDELSALLLHPGEFPRSFTITVGSRVITARLEDSAHYDRAAAERHRAWRLTGDHDPTARHALYRELYRHMIGLDAQEQRNVVAALRAAAIRLDDGAPVRRTMTAAEVSQLAASRVATIGSHTVTHAALGELRTDHIGAEIRDSVRELEGMTGRRIAAFSYPHGSWSRHVLPLLAAAGIEAACTTEPAPVRKSSRPLTLPRYVVADCDGAELQRLLAEALSAQ